MSIKVREISLGVACAALLLTSCTSDGREDGPDMGAGLDPSGDGDGDGTAQGDGDGDGDGDGGGDGDGDGDGSTVMFDVATGDPEGGDDEGCEKVDFLFVIDASPSMEDEQQQLLDSFPDFITTIEETLTAQDYQLMVVDVDSHPQYTPVGSNGFCEDGTCCDSVCSADPQANWCNNEPCGDHSGECQFTLGAGKSEDRDWDDCGLPGGKRYLQGGGPELLADFSCIAEVGTYGYFDEMQAGAAVEAIDSALVGPGGCNEGFLRDDAILVVTVISDEEDRLGPSQGSQGDPPDWYDALVEAKGGNSDAIVMLGLVGDYGQPGSTCQPLGQNGVGGADDAVRLREWVTMFGERGLLGSVCVPDYGPFFDEAVALIDTACDEFEPIG